MDWNVDASAILSCFGTTNDRSEFRYVHSCDLDLTGVQVKIGTLEGSGLPRLNYEHLLEDTRMAFCGRNQDKYPDLVVEAVVVDGTPPTFDYKQTKLSQPSSALHRPISTSYKHFTKRWDWNEWIRFPLKYADLPRSAQLCITIYDLGGSKLDSGKDSNLRTAIGGTTISFFGKKGILRQGQMDLRVWAETAADPSNPTTTPGKPSLVSTNSDELNPNQDFYRLGKLIKQYRSGKIQPVEWLDGPSFAEITKVYSAEKERSNLLFLMVEFPEFRLNGELHSIVYYEEEDVTAMQNASYQSVKVVVSSSQSDIILLPDFEIHCKNIVESKHRDLARSAHAVDKELKPDTASLRNRLNEITEYLPTRSLTAEEQDLVWRYRFYLADNKRALTKFVKCINWQVSNEANQALEHIITKWAPMDVEDALELLGPTFQHPGLRQYAVSRLGQSADSDLQLYLLQLVQALKYEDYEENKVNDYSYQLILDNNVTDSDINSPSTELPTVPAATSVSSGKGLAQFLIERACQNDVIANYFYWYLMVECEEFCENKNNNLGQQSSFHSHYLISNLTTRQLEALDLATQDNKYQTAKSALESKDTGNGNGIASKEQRVQNMYHKVLQQFRFTLKQGPIEWRERLLFLERQKNFVDRLAELVKAVKRDSGTRQKKEEKLRALLKSTGNTVLGQLQDSAGGGSITKEWLRHGKQKVESAGHQKASKSAATFNFMKFEPPLKLPLDPDITVKGIVPSEATLYKSAVTPVRLTFIRDDTCENYVTIFKHGDDLRQDQLILQIITLMDRILQQENLDLKLTPYRALATSSRHGFVQYVESSAIADILHKEGSIHNFFLKHNPCESAPYGIQPEVMDTYVKSCAGYCVITYLLGVGDRHLDNLLLTKSGKMFHIDFGYILGRDPKPMPPPMRLSKEMIEAFGGMESQHYQEFRRECYTVFLSLRRHANLILNLFSLMEDASVPDIALEPDKTVRKVQDKFRLDFSDEEAVIYMQDLIDVSACAVMAALAEKFHKWSQYMRS